MLLNRNPYSKEQVLSFSVYSTLFCCSYATFCWLLNLQFKKRKEYNQISQAKIYSVKEIFDLLQEQQKESENTTTTTHLSLLHKELKQLFEHPKESTTNKRISKPIFIEGKIEIIDDLFYLSKFQPNEKLVVQQIEQHQLYSNRHLLTTRQKFNINLKRKIVKKFLITDDDSQSKCEVKLPKNQTFFDGIIKYIGEKKIKYPKTTKLKIYKMLSFIAHVFVRAISSGFLQIRGLKIGYIEKEFGLTVQTGLIFYTKVGFNLKNQKLTIKNPIAIMTEKCQFLKTLKYKMNFCLLPLVVSASFSIFFLIKLIKLYKESQIKAVDDNVYNDDQLNNLNDDIKCIICFGAPRTLILEPCKHLAICRGCYEKLQRKECPICKQQILGYYEIKMKKK